MKILTALLFVVLTLAQAKEVYKKTISFEWDPVAGAKRYQVQFTNQKNNAQVITDFFTETNSYTGPIPPGLYKMKLRSLDNRNVPGVWSEEVAFPVLLDKVEVSKPAKATLEVKSLSADTDEIHFEWKEVLGADKYSLKIFDADSRTEILDQIIDDSKAVISLPVGKKYTWSITALDSGDLRSEVDTTGEVTMIGKKLDKPAITSPENQFVRDISWTQDPYAQTYAIELQKFQPPSKKWQKLVQDRHYVGNKIVIDPKWPGGIYRVIVRSTAKLRPNSDRASLIFKVKNGDRSPSAEYTYVLKKSIDRINGWYGIASWFASMINYSSSYKGFNPKYSIFGGTGRVGVGWFKEGNPWGFSGVVDISGFLKDESYKSSYIYNSMYLNGIYRKTVRETDEFRVKGGLFYKEIPQTLADITEVSNYFNANNRSLTGFKGTNNQNISMIGPHVGFEYWFSLTPKLGFQVNTNWYYSMAAVRLPNNGTGFSPSISDEYGVLGSYKVSQKFTGLLGLTYRKDQVSYKDESTTNAFNWTPANEEYNKNVNVNTSVNGFYFSLFAEYQF
ncbi:MAG: hypothetical protein JNL11_17555 [Bdellovibrionaceae bacterium]|nr:hypothetical protein [Pseudobdellovibrionaceae bacterium]